jgi:hypothetical protein
MESEIRDGKWLISWEKKDRVDCDRREEAVDSPWLSATERGEPGARIAAVRWYLCVKKAIGAVFGVARPIGSVC